VIQENLHRSLGASGINVSSLGAGTNKWARGKNDEAVFEAYQSLMDRGVNFFDTAEVYGSGRSERLLGACLQRDNRPVVIATKFAPLPTRLSRRQFMNALDASLSRLGIRTIDLYYIHFPFSLLSIERLMDMMAAAVEAGKIRAVGVSNFNAEQMRRAAERLARYDIPLAANQVRYNLLNRQPEENGVLNACRELDVALVAYRPLEGGRLKSSSVSGAPLSGQSLATDREEDLALREEALQQTLQTVAQERSRTASQVALNWLLRKDEHVIPIPGATSKHHALENADTLTWELSHDEFVAIDQASSPWKQYTGRESRKLLRHMVSFRVRRWLRDRS
jgi:aryl-alcohol dehydrogenase-like predicted oxidoreductase